MQKLNKLKALTALTVVALATAFIGNACGEFQSSGSGSNSGLNYADCSSSQDFELIDGAKTVAVVYGDQVLENMVTCTALADISQATLDENEARKPSFSQYGYVGDVTSAMMMGVAAVAIEVCDDLADQEIGLAASSRRIFNSVDLASMSDLDNAAIDDTTTRLARSCWGRMPSNEELQIVREEMAAMGATSSRLKAIGVCASVLGSLDGIMQ